jgi:hypothetical protein
VDFIADDEDMREVNRWVVANAPFDRLHFYGADRPIHVSYLPEQAPGGVDGGGQGRAVAAGVVSVAAFLLHD